MCSKLELGESWAQILAPDAKGVRIWRVEEPTTTRITRPSPQVPKLLYYILRLADAATPAATARVRAASVNFSRDAKPFD